MRATPPEVVRAVKLLDLRTKRLVSGQFGGAYRAVFKGHGIEFAELREYQPGDEVRTIDWNVTARTRRPHVRRYVEERELSVLVLLDVSGSAWFGTQRQLKGQVAAELTAALVLAAARQNDRVGVIAVSDRVELLRPPRKGRRPALALARDVLALEPARRGTALTPAADAAGPALPQRGIVFVVSDFDAPDAERSLRRLALRHDVIAVPVEDPAEFSLPDVGIARLADPETGAGIEVDTSDPAVRVLFARRARAAREARDRMLQASGADVVRVTTDGGFLDPMLRYLRSRAGRRGG
ncbi:MAG: DUF58 domain-containing protein [Gemmatimonadota bacterium]